MVDARLTYLDHHVATCCLDGLGGQHDRRDAFRPFGRRAVQAGGTVRWAAQGTAGVELMHMNLQAQDEIWRYYAQESARQRAGGARPPEPSVSIRGPDGLRESALNAWRRFIREHG